MSLRFRCYLVVLLFACTPFALAQGGRSFADAGKSAVPYDKTSVRAQVSCAGLTALTNNDYSVTSATLIEAADGAPEYCRVLGVIPPEIRFSVDLPTDWNRRLYMYGNGGFAGSPPEAPARIAASQRALKRGFATTYTDTGHDSTVEPLGSFALNNLQKEIDYSFRAVHLTLRTAKTIAAHYYDAPPNFSYWDGCSTGGRQGLMSAQRFPDDFDGVLAGAPVLNFSGTMISYAWTQQALTKAPLSIAKVELLGRKVYERCDKLDGVTDGLIEDPRQCDFEPSQHLKQCDGATGPDCFSAPEVAALSLFYADVRGGGETLFPGWPLGAEPAPLSGSNSASGWNRWIVNENGPPIEQVFAESFFRNLAFRPDEPEFDWRKFDFNKDPQRMSFIHSILDATNPDLSGFRDRGGKLLMYFGWADTALNPMMGINYYEDTVKTMGPQTDDFFRLYMVPGMFHCGGGLGVDQFDAFTRLVNWVEGGETPERIDAARVIDGKVELTRPLCPYPQVAKYSGSGDPNAAANFACAVP
ncbi:MAG: tannase/feruloyl esterase family alpha/beta hydrolase [Acidobacteria bacterium]|nr:tannase/feruloyl esterase family alpha/beta hydrolase [Acidobacteriota bacterium]MDA1233660.1 tannase/feruloyl esterase family alpha/beta hydrolase [Acidobacteriota bacterium]